MLCFSHSSRSRESFNHCQRWSHLRTIVLLNRQVSRFVDRSIDHWSTDSSSLFFVVGNPKDGIHLARRPDILLTFCSSKGWTRFGLLICKVRGCETRNKIWNQCMIQILLGKGYSTIPSEKNETFPAQLHYDYHFCKSPPTSFEQEPVRELLAKSLVNVPIWSRSNQSICLLRSSATNIKIFKFFLVPHKFCRWPFFGTIFRNSSFDQLHWNVPLRNRKTRSLMQKWSPFGKTIFLLLLLLLLWKIPFLNLI